MAAPFRDVQRQLREYWEGRRQTFDLPLRPQGTAFQQRVWTQIALVPFGATITYRELATRAGSPDGSRAAGLATGRNPISIVIPCHRIIGTNGSLTGFGGGLDRKRALLGFESAVAQGTKTPSVMGMLTFVSTPPDCAARFGVIASGPDTRSV